MVAQTKNRRAARRLVGAHALEDRRAVVQRMRKHVHRRLLPGHELAVEPDELRRWDGHGVSFRIESHRGGQYVRCAALLARAAVRLRKLDAVQYLEECLCAGFDDI